MQKTFKIENSMKKICAKLILTQNPTLCPLGPYILDFIYGLLLLVYKIMLKLNPQDVKYCRQAFAISLKIHIISFQHIRRRANNRCGKCGKQVRKTHKTERENSPHGLRWHCAQRHP